MKVRMGVKFTVGLLSVWIIAGGSMSYFIYTSNRNALQETITVRLQEHAAHLMGKIDRYIYERYVDIKMLSEDPVVTSNTSTPKQIKRRLLQYRDTHNAYSSLYFLDANRIKIADTEDENIGKKHELAKYWEEVEKNGVSIASDIYISSSSGNIDVHFAAAVNDARGKLRGVVVSKMPIEQIYEIARESIDVYGQNEKDAIEIDLVDDKGLLLFATQNKAGILKENYSYLESVQKSLKGVKGGISIHFDPVSKEDDFYAFVREKGFADFRGNNWTLLVHLPVKVAFAPAVELGRKMLFVLLWISIVGIIIVISIIRFITNPIVLLRDAIRRVAAGNFNTFVEIKSNDEIGDLADSFNGMVEQIQAAQELIQAQNQELAASNQELISGNEELQATTEELREANEQLRDFRQGLEEQIRERMKELQNAKTELEAKVQQLERFNRIAVGRELRMRELKKKFDEFKMKHRG
ncbi:MAG: HAMP domain-containing protein [bacterium]